MGGWCANKGQPDQRLVHPEYVTDAVVRYDLRVGTSLNLTLVDCSSRLINRIWTDLEFRG